MEFVILVYVVFVLRKEVIDQFVMVSDVPVEKFVQAFLAIWSILHSSVVMAPPCPGISKTFNGCSMGPLVALDILP